MQSGGNKLLWVAVWATAWIATIQAKAACAQNAVPAVPNPVPPTATSLTSDSSAEIVGIWQGTLHLAQVNQDMRAEIKIANDSKDGYKATFYSIDQGGQPMVAARTQFKNGVLSFSIDFLQVKYEGKMSADGKTITGIWTQGPNTMALSLERTSADAAWPIPEPPKPMAANAHPDFDTVTIKPSRPDDGRKLLTIRGRSVIATKNNLDDLLSLAYGVHAKQVIGAPDWARTDMFDIDGIPNMPGRPNWQQLSELFQKLLTERFQLKFHHEVREISVYAITVSNKEPKFTIATAAPADPPAIRVGGLGDMRMHNETLKEFAYQLQAIVMDKPVIDRTGLTGKYDFTLKWTPDESQYQQFRGAENLPLPASSDNPNAPPSLYTAMQEQLGLKIETVKAMDDVIVVDHVEKPSPN